MYKQEMWIIDSFTKVAFKGNPAGVCLLEEYPSNITLQSIAMEINLAETAFLVKRGENEYDLRWFTPLLEVPLCGHATLAAAHMLHTAGHVKTGEHITFHSRSGDLHATPKEDKIRLDFPLLPGEKVDAPKGTKGIGVSFSGCYKNRDNYLVEVADYETLLSITPNFDKLAELECIGIIATTNKGVPDGYDFASRFFAPMSGINEDPVTGSAHCFLAPFWQDKLGKDTFRALQASKREGTLELRIEDDRVFICGEAVVTLRGELMLESPIKKETSA